MRAYHRRVPEPPPNDEPVDPQQGRFSLHNLSAAFARLTNTSEPTSTTSEMAEALGELQDEATAVPSEVLSPRMIIEGMLFVGNSNERPLTSREMASHIRDVSPSEVEALIDELNQLYAQTNAAYRIARQDKGFHFVLAASFEGVRQRLRGQIRETKLTPSALEVLSVVAYRQPINAEDVTQLRNNRSHTILNQLVRRGLLRLDRPKNSARKPTYYTTDRFNTLFGIQSPEDLPSSEDLDDK
jgi:segregation and condensation protein B